MYTYFFTLTYVGADPFIQALMNLLSRGGTGQLRLNVTLTPAQVQVVRNQATTAGFQFSNITRVPVPPDPEAVA